MSAIILLAQPMLHEITDVAMHDSLPAELKSRLALAVRVDIAAALQRAVENGRWEEVRAQLVEVYERDVRSVLSQHPEEVVAYFGSSPVPAAVMLGWLIGAWPKVLPFQRHHLRRDWGWQPPGESIQLHVDGLPRDRVETAGDVIVRISASALVDGASTRVIVPRPLAEVDIVVTPTNEDAFQRPDDLARVADAWKEALDVLGQARPNATRIHLFAAVPAGLAFLLGTRISTTMVALVQTYQFNRAADPHHKPALLLQRAASDRSELSDDERCRAAELRPEWGEQLAALAKFATELKRLAGRKSWIKVVGGQEAQALKATFGLLPAIWDTAIVSSTMGLAGTGAFYDSGTRRWHVPDELVLRFAAHFPKLVDRQRAIRMFLLHESLHEQTHCLTGSTSAGVGRFAKVLERIDYEADVWAMLHEHALSATNSLEEDVRNRWIGILRTAIDTFWAFDGGEEPMREIEVRRVNRYLNWYWQLLLIERCAGLERIYNVLVVRPDVEIAGAKVDVRGDRTVYLLGEPLMTPELAVVHARSIHRFSDGPAFSLAAVIDAFRRRDGASVLAGLRRAFDQLQR